MAAVDGGNTTTNQKLVPAAEKTREKAHDRDGTCVGGILQRTTMAIKKQAENGQMTLMGKYHNLDSGHVRFFRLR
jgi:hypothetical protein